MKVVDLNSGIAAMCTAANQCRCIQRSVTSYHGARNAVLDAAIALARLLEHEAQSIQELEAQKDQQE